MAKRMTDERFAEIQSAHAAILGGRDPNADKNILDARVRAVYGENQDGMTAHEHRAELLAALKTERELNRWRPIEEAPRDGTYVLLYEPGHPAIEGDCGFVDLGCFVGGAWESRFGAGVEPTLWKPEPEPPEQP